MKIKRVLSMNRIKNFKKKISGLTLCLMSVMMTFPVSVFAESDPASKAADHMKTILFGTLGTSLCAIIIGATFIMAKTGKITWDRFIFIGFCTAGFLGAPSIVTSIKGWV